MVEYLRILIRRWLLPYMAAAGKKPRKWSKTARLLRGAGIHVHVRADVVGRRHHLQAGRLGVERPFQGAQAARAELLVDRRLLRRAVGEFSHHHVDVEALPA